MSIQVDIEDLGDAVYVYITGTDGLVETEIAGRTVRLYVNAVRPAPTTARAGADPCA